MNKKAVGKEILYFMATVFIIILLVVFFFVSKFFSPNASEITSKFSINEQNTISYLSLMKTKVNVEGQNITMADLIRLSQMNSKYQSILKEESGKLFDPIYGKNIYLVLSSPSPRFYLEVLTTDYVINKENVLDIVLPSYPELLVSFGIGDKWGQEK